MENLHYPLYLISLTQPSQGDVVIPCPTDVIACTPTVRVLGSSPRLLMSSAAWFKFDLYRKTN